MKNVLVLSLSIPLLSILAGCSSPCDDAPGPHPSTWEAHPDFVAPGGTVCRADASSADIDYEHDSNPFVVIVQHLEGQGWGRSRQDVSNMSYMTVTLQKGAETLDVTISDDGDYGTASYRLH